MSQAQGKFVWYELMTTDTKAAAQFYRKLIGWNMDAFEHGNFTYEIFKAGEVPIGGLMTLPAEACEAGAQPGWLGYIAADDVDATAARIRATGGTVHRQPADIPDVGRFAVVADPQGAVFALFRGKDCGEDYGQVALGTPGHGGWHELMARDWASVFPFYAEIFGWTKADALDMGEMGTYQLFAWNGQPIRGMMNKPKDIPQPFWGYYFNVPEIRTAQEIVTRNGGAVLNGPAQVPGGSWIMQCKDPQGVFFSVAAPPA
ncbi:VOC family protein [Rhodoligotrophos ferricapiens]|uniref:VOC family protein n=1 Tax=Rhodoligotrophos ferricapiens TaxID=3069264 RepID=UPI00315D09A8